MCQSSEDLSGVPDRSVDAVITDPPYFDNLQYSELADFFYVWLRLALKDTYPWFAPELSGRSREIVKNDKLNKTTEFFNEGLRRVFTECHRTLKDDGLLVFTFHHNKLWAWQGIGQLLLNAGFYVSASPLVRSEGKSGYHSSEGNIKYDCVMVCRKRPSPHEDQLRSSREAVLGEAANWTRRTLDSGMPVNEVDVFAAVMGQSLRYYTTAASNGHSQDLGPSLDWFLNDMSTLVANLEVGSMSPDTESEPYAAEVRQLALFVMESKARYGEKPASG